MSKYSNKELEIINALGLNNEELEPNENDYKSWEFYLIKYYSNEELYYLDEESEEVLNSADEIQDTPKGKVFAFK